MSMLFDDIMSSLNELKEHAEGKPTGVVVHRRNAPTIADVPEFTPKEIKEVRLASGMTQRTFAACVGVSVKSIESWEGGRSRPDGAARRILGMMKSNPSFAEDMGLIISA